MSTAIMDYQPLVSEVQPKVIHDEQMNLKFISILEKLDSRWDTLFTAEKEIHELLTLLIETYERKHYPLRAATPIEALTELMQANELKQKDLVGVFETTSVVSEVLSGKRPMTVEHIRRLSKRFRVSADLFI
ncbi:MAG: putative transcription regulator containing domain [Candidatus Angelobacter sp.]|jgi:HTH-type transcriptional regulator/antitoxin HigA|nr:putative transcription regulator containing domain [Candidatus Angelobacter sp.]